MNPYHQEVLSLIEEKSGTPTKHTHLDSYLGNSHPRYPINNPTLRTIAKDWMREHRDMTSKQFVAMLTSMVKGKSGTEKMMVGVLLDYATKDQKQFDATVVDKWLDHLEGWVEIDHLCSGKYSRSEVPKDVATWKKILTGFAKSKNINKRRASIVFLVAPLSESDDEKLADLALANIDKLKGEKEVIITKAISWVLRNMIKHHRKAVEKYLNQNKETLPKIAVRETLVKLKTGRKSKQ